MYLCSAQIEDSLEQNKCNLCWEKGRDFSSQEETGCDCPYLGRANIIVAFKTSCIYYPKHNGTLSIKSVFSDGEELYETDEGRFTVDKNRYLVLNSGHEYSSQIRPGRDVESFCIFFARPFVEDSFRNFKFSHMKLLNEPEQSVEYPLFIEKLYNYDEIMNSLMKNLHSSVNNRTLTRQKLEEIFYRLLERLFLVNKYVMAEIEGIAALKHTTRLEIFRRLESARDFIHSNFNREIELKEIASAACLSPFHFLRLFKELFHETPHQYLNRYRMKKARNLLLNTKFSITDITMDVGFESNSHFSRLFQRYFGMSPKNFRKNSLTEKKSNFEQEIFSE